MFKQVKKTKVVLPKTAEEREEARIQSFLDMAAPSAIKFFPDYYVCGSSFRSVWAIREYPTQTNELAILRHLGEKSGVTLKIYSRHVTPSEERKIIANASSKNRLQQSSSSDLQKNIIAESNLKDVVNLVANIHRNKEPLLHIAVYIEISAVTLDGLKNIQSEVMAELTRSKITADKLLIRQQEGFMCVQPCGKNVLGGLFERVLPASSAANLYPFSFSGKTDPNGFYLGQDKFGSNIIVDFQRRDRDKSNANVLVLGNSGQGKSYLMKFLITNTRESGMKVAVLDPDKEYADLTKNLGGYYIDLMTGEYKINVMQPKLWDEEVKNASAEKKVSTKLSQHISFLRDFFRAYKNFGEEQIDTLEIIIQKLYKSFNIDDMTDWKTLKPEDYPILSDLYTLLKSEYDGFDDGKNKIYTKEVLRELCVSLHSMCVGAEAKFFDGYTNIGSKKFVCFGLKELLSANVNLKNAMLFNVLSYLSDVLLTEGNAAAFIDELYLFLTNLVAVEYIRNFMKRVRKKDSAVIIASQNIEDFTINGLAEFTKPLFAIPTHQFIFNSGVVDKSVYMNFLQLDESEYELIKYPQKGICLFKCGLERYNLVVKAPDYKMELFGTAGGR